jgi:ABC-type sugar transport system substrate-binding protein
MTALQKNPAGVIVAGETPSDFNTSVINAYASAKVPIVAGSTCPVPSIGTVVAGSGTCETNPRYGKALADWVVANADGKPVDVLMQSMPQYNVYIGFRNAFRAELKRLCPACQSTIQDTTLAEFASGGIPAALVNTLRANPSYNYLVFDNGAWAQGIQTALTAAGLQGKVTIIGNGINSDILSGLKADDFAAWSADSFEIYGMGSFDSLLRALTNSPGIDENSALPFQLVTADTAKNVTVPYAQPATALAQYLKLWHW